MKSTRAVISVKDLRLVRGGVVILDQVSWEVRQGENWVILGANGSGKTSLLSAITGYLTPSGGTIRLLGERYGAADWLELRKRVGLVSSAIRQLMANHEPALLSVISGRFAMIDYWGRISKADRARGLQILRQVECEHLAERPWLYLSQGERQRILIGRALMARPRLIILDEPCAGLDPAAREHFLQFLQRLGSRNQGPALVFVTHHVEEIMPTFSHLLVLRKGRVLVAGPVAKGLTHEIIGRAFGVTVQLKKRGGRYELAVAGRPRRVL